MATVSKIITYPFKSAKGIELPESGFDIEGMLNDRRLMAVDEHSTFMTARNTPELLQITCEPTTAGWTLSHPKAASALKVTADSPLLISSEVWDDKITTTDAGNEAAEWLSHVLGEKSRIALWKPQSRHSSKYDVDTSFADAAPLLIASEASMKQGCDWADINYDHRRFRPNIIVSGVEAFEEESWTRIQIGSAIFELLDTCERCVLTTRDPDSGAKHPKQQPLRALIKNHINATKHPIMGINAKLVSSATEAKITLNDKIKLL